MGRAFRTPIVLSPDAGILAAVMVLTVPLRWLLAWAAAALCHECFHLLALCLSGSGIHSICVGALGTRIRTDPLRPGQTILCALAGPAAGFVLMLSSPWLPRLALCGLFQSLFNLLPVRPLDGSLALQGALRCFLAGETAEILCSRVEAVFLLVLAVLCFMSALRWQLGPGPVLLALLLLLRLRKIPCKYTRSRVQ